jgi:hypothetical protein
MSWRARVRLMVLCVVLGVVSAAQTMALEDLQQPPEGGESWCKPGALDCGCPLTWNNLTLISATCQCDSRGSWRTCTYGE